MWASGFHSSERSTSIDERQAIIASGRIIDKTAAERIQHLVPQPIGNAYRT
jgi:hypothetical protein